MTPFETGAVIVAVFLAIGITVGVLIVVALPQVRYYRNARRYMNGGDWEEPPSLDEDGNPPRWPEG